MTTSASPSSTSFAVTEAHDDTSTSDPKAAAARAQGATADAIDAADVEASGLETSGRVRVIRAHPGRALVIAAAVLALVALAVVAATGLARVGVLVALHASSVALAAWGLRRMRDDDHAGDAWRLLGIATAGLGALGVIVAAASVGLARWFTRRGAAEHPAWLSVVGAADARPLVERSDATVEATLSRKSVVVPFADVLSQGTTEHKQEMIAVISGHFRPPFARALREAMNDPEPTVRVMAAAASTRIENDFLDSSMSLETHWANAPSDSRRALDLARHYDEFAATNLLDENRADEARARALEMYQLAAQETPRDETIAQAIVRLMLKLGREDDAIDAYRGAMEDGTASTTLASWYLECLFRRRRFGELRRFSEVLCRTGRDIDKLAERAMQAARFWSEGPEPAPKPAEAPGVDVLLDTAGVYVGEREQRREQLRFEVPYFQPNLPT